MEKIKMKPGFGLMAAGVCFLWNPLVNVIDILPDAFGWLLIAIAMTTLSYVYDDIAEARKSAWILCGISVVKLAPMAFSIIGAKRFPLLAEPVLVLVYALVFGLFECMLGVRVLKLWIHRISQIGLMHDSKQAIRGSDSLILLTRIFFLIRAAASIVPELVYLRSTEYLGNVVYGVVIDIRDYRPYLIVFCALIAGIFGICWLVRMLRYLLRVGNEQNRPVFAAIRALEDSCQTVLFRKSTLERFRIALGLILLGGVFLCYFSFENIDILPDFVGIVLLLSAAWVVQKRFPFPKTVYRLGIVTVILTIPYYLVRLWHSVTHHGFWADSIFDYLTRNIAVSAEKQEREMQLQLLMLLLAVLETALLICFFGKYLKALHSTNALHSANKLSGMTKNNGVTPYAVTPYDGMTKSDMQIRKVQDEKLPKKVFVWFCISAGMEVLRALPIFSFVVTPIAFVRIVINITFLVMLQNDLTMLMQQISCYFEGQCPDTEQSVK